MSQRSILFPQMGVSVEEGTIVAWHVREGDTVEIDQVVCEISTDKVDTEVQSPAAGTVIRILVAAGDTAPVGGTLALVDASSEAAALPGAPTGPTSGTLVSEAAAGNEITADEPVPIDITTAPRAYDYGAEAAVAVPNGASPAWSPVARRIATAHGVDPVTVIGTGRHGRVRKADVLARVGAGPGPDRAAEAPPTVAPPFLTDLTSVLAPTSPVATVAAPLPAVVGGGVPRGYEDVPFEIVPTSPIRRAIAEHMSRSRRTAAHMTTEVEVDMYQVARIRADLNRARSTVGTVKLSFLSFVVRAACAALVEFPDLNATFEDERLIRWREINLGIAVDTDRGLLAPVIRGCQELTVATIADRIADLAARARARTLAADDMRAGTFTVSNPGSVGAISAPAIINQPQVAILGTPAIVKRATVVTGPDGEDAISIRPIMLLALTFDHRAIDGAQATRCAVAIKQRLEHWDAAAYS